MSLLNRASNLIWAMEASALQQMFQILARIDLDAEKAKAILAERERRFEADIYGPEYGAIQAKPGKRVMGTKLARKREPNIGIIPVIGPIIRHADMFTDLSGETGIETLARDFNFLLDAKDIEQIVFYFDSPGGEANGTNEFAQMVYDSRGKKPIDAYVGGMCASGALWIASACDRIRADAIAIVGSVGVMARVLDTSRAETMMGFEEIVIRSDVSPNKNLPANTPEGRQNILEVANGIADVFVTTLARNRGVTREKVIGDYGQGKVMVGQAAVNAGMVDSLASFEQGLLVDTSRTDALLPQSPLEDNKAKSQTGGRSTASESNGGSDMSWINKLFGNMTAEEKKEAEAALKASNTQEASGTQAAPAQQPPPTTQTMTLAEGAATIQPSPQVAAMQAELDRMKAERHQERLEAINQSAESFYMQQLKVANTVLPAEKDQVIQDYVTAATDDLLYPVKAEEGKPVVTRVAKLQSRYAARPKHKLTTEMVSDRQFFALSADSAAPDPLAAAEKSAEAYAAQRNGASNRVN